MTATKGGPTDRRIHEPAAGTATAEAIERARRDMLHEVRIEHRTRIGADVVCEALLRQGADVLFGYPGGVILPLYDVFGDYPELRHGPRPPRAGRRARRRRLRPRDRQGRRLHRHLRPRRDEPRHRHRHRPARLDPDGRDHRQRRRRRSSGKDAFQEIDITGITLPMTKHNYLVRNADDLPRVLAEAFHIARTGRPGPVHVDITKDALQQETRAQHPTDEEVLAGLPGFRPTLDGHPRQLRLAAHEIAKAKRPVILAGHGILIAEAWDELRELRREGAASPWPGRSSGSARWTRRTRSPTATWGCTAGST